MAVTENEDAKAILKKHKLRVTPMRMEVLNVFLSNSSNALSNQQFESEIEVTDRVTLYRTLKTFQKNGIIHEVLDGSGASKYALCHHDCSSHEHLDNHAHFHCITCEKTICLEEIETPEITLPKGFSSSESYLVFKGVCETCK